MMPSPMPAAAAARRCAAWVPLSRSRQRDGGSTRRRANRSEICRGVCSCSWRAMHEPAVVLEHDWALLGLFSSLCFAAEPPTRAESQPPPEPSAALRATTQPPAAIKRARHARGACTCRNRHAGRRRQRRAALLPSRRAAAAASTTAAPHDRAEARQRRWRPMARAEAGRPQRRAPVRRARGDRRRARASLRRPADSASTPYIARR